MSEREPAPVRRRVGDANDPRFKLQHAGLSKRRHPIMRRVGGGIGEIVGEVLIGLLIVGLFAGLATAAAFGWQHSRPLVIGLGIAIGLFLAYGGFHLIRASLGGTSPRWPRIAAAAGITLLVCVLLATYLPY